MIYGEYILRNLILFILIYWTYTSRLSAWHQVLACKTSSIYKNEIATRKFTTRDKYKLELHKECATKPAGVAPPSHLHAQAISGEVIWPLSHGGSKFDVNNKHINIFQMTIFNYNDKFFNYGFLNSLKNVKIWHFLGNYFLHHQWNNFVIVIDHFKNT